MKNDSSVPHGDLIRVVNQVLATAGSDGSDDDLFVRQNEQRLRETAD